MDELKFMSQNGRERLPDLEEVDIQEVLKSHAAVLTEGTSNNRQRSLNPKMKIRTLLWRGPAWLTVLWRKAGRRLVTQSIIMLLGWPVYG